MTVFFVVSFLKCRYTAVASHLSPLEGFSSSLLIDVEMKQPFIENKWKGSSVGVVVPLKYDPMSRNDIYVF